MEPADYSRSLNEHYGRSGLGAAILAGVAAAGKNPDALRPDDLAPVDHFHTRGRDSTLALARLAGLAPEMRLLDVGGGIGGPARTLAQEVGCHVTVLDLTEEFCRVGADLTARTTLADRVAFRHGNALDMPFPDASFDTAWTQHSSMNIEDKERLYREIQRVIAPGGRLAFHEIMAGPQAPIHFPVPWAREASMSFLQPPAAIRTLLGRLGFEETTWTDVSGPSLDWFRQRAAAASSVGAPPPLGLHLLLGADFGRMFSNVARNLEEKRVAIIKAVWRRP